MWDAIGLKQSAEKLEQLGADMPGWIKEMLDKGNETFYIKENGTVFYYDRGEYRAVKENKNEFIYKHLKKQKA